MKLLITFLLTLIINLSFSQSSVVYKRNPFGELEVYQSQGGLPTGSPIYKIKKNVYGYLEVENVDASTNPFTKKPDYANYNNFKPYQLPAKEIFTTLEVLNKRTEYDQLITNPNTSINSTASQLLKDAQTFMQNRSVIATNLLNFYNSNVEFPKKLKDGWYDVTKISKYTPNETEQRMGFKEGNEFTIGICKVVSNRISEYYENINLFDLKTGFVFQKINLDVASTVNNCKSTYRTKNENQYNTIYFLDNILDSAKQIESPDFGYYTINTANNFNSQNLTMSVQVARNKSVTRDEVLNLQAGPYQLTVFKPNPSTGDCSNSAITLAFRKSLDKFSIGIVRLTDKAVWTMNDLAFSPGTCSSTTLNER